MRGLEFDKVFDKSLHSRSWSGEMKKGMGTRYGISRLRAVRFIWAKASRHTSINGALIRIYI